MSTQTTPRRAADVAHDGEPVRFELLAPGAL